MINGDEAGEVPIGTESDIVVARRAVRDIAARIGFNPTETTRIVTAASELARNVYKYGRGGMMHWRAVRDGRVKGIELVFEDKGPGIADIAEAMREGYSTGGGLGIGLPGTKRLMDEMEIRTVVGQGTAVTVRRWQRK